MADSMDKKYSNVPNLRFSEFSDEWNFLKLKNCCKFFSGGTPLSTNKELYKGTIPFIRSGEIHSDKTELFISEQALKCSSAKMVNSGDLLLALYGATSGEIDISKITGAINQAILCIRTNQNNKFIKYQWQKNKNRILETYLQGGQGNLSGQIVSSLSFGFPMLEEQNKIVSLMDKIEERINTQNKIISAKKSLMKNIVVGMKNDSASSVALSSIAEIYQPQTLAQNELIPGDYYVYGANGIIGKHNRYNHENEEICLTCRGSTCGNLCLSKPFSWINGNAMVIKTNNNINKHFVYYALLKINWSKYISGSGQPQIVRSAIQNIRINLPDIEIQNKISIVLDTLNDSIEAELLLLNKLNELKRYLLSNLFI